MWVNSFFDKHFPHHAHNGYLEILLAVGLIGMLIFLINLFGNALLALKRAYFYRVAEAWLPLIFLLVVVIMNSTESQLLRTSGKADFWVMYILLSISLKLPFHSYTGFTSRGVVR